MQLTPTTNADAPAAEAEAKVDSALRILVVDDQEIICELISVYLRGDGHEPVTAVDGQSALDAFRAGSFGLVITDQSMPGLDGVQLAAAVKAHAPKVPVILLTGYGDEMQSSSGGLPAGVDLLLSKPVSAVDLRHAVAQAMRRGLPGGSDQTT